MSVLERWIAHLKSSPGEATVGVGNLLNSSFSILVHSILILIFPLSSVSNKNLLFPHDQHLSEELFKVQNKVYLFILY